MTVPTPATPQVHAEEDVDRYDAGYRSWLAEALAKVQADANRSSDTHLLAVPLPEQWGVDLYLKDESTHPTGSLKHRLARSLFLHALCNGWIRPGKPVIEASSGSTAISEAYFARLIGVPFIAVMARSTSQQKVQLIEFYGGQCHSVENPNEVYEAAAALARQTGGHYMDQFTYAERATDWRGNNNIAESIFDQMSQERHPEPAWIVATAGTGGTSATLARYIRYTGRATGICVADPENSAFFPAWREQDASVTTATGSRIEGIGRQRVEASFIGSAIDRMMRVPDAAAMASIRLLAELLGRRTGASTGTGLWSAFRIISEMINTGQQGSVVSLICDPGDRYLDKYYSDEWLVENKIDVGPYYRRLETFMNTGTLS
ncbi:PLP-dependent cysteine synthase family protein [Arthrobacter crystallopoietes]|uniref:PLP-dependent cysteine synthase family protein n=1 Tax=Crystallibacter crystallopoietes TaxID=37928 RepID=UPI0011115C7F|nr:PLP-dependent cysteine synthase family protein [Arthrobacter crystallopoietes]QTG82051.1 PLP-dependent cysteine synthase family protein [Arthrobacter crystallopoietes]